MPQLSFRLHPIPPFRLDLTAWALRRRANNVIDRWDGRAYRRVVLVDDHPVELEAAQAGTTARPELEVIARGESLPKRTREAATAALDRALGLSVDLRPFYRLGRQDARLDALTTRFRGVKPPRFPSVFEAVVNGIACQQLSLAVGIILLDRLTSRCGRPASARSSVRAFPRARDVAALKPSDLRPLGFSYAKVYALLELAERVESGLDLEAVTALDDEAAVEELMKLRGVGRWTAEYVLLRGLGRWHLFPGDDVGARTNLGRWMKLREPLDYESVRRLSRRWEPYAGLLYFHLLLDQLEQSGILGGEASADRPDRGEHAQPGALSRARPRAAQRARPAPPRSRRRSPGSRRAHAP